jgi:tryptophan synthase
MNQTLPSLSSDVANAFANAKAEGRPAFIPYITAGYPRASDTVPVLLALQANGADIIEIGVPFSDPIADGNTIQAANQQALDNGVSLQDTIEYVVEARKQGLTVPIVLMGYYNPFLQFGEQKLVDTCADARIHGFIVVDLPPVEALQFRTICDSRDMCLVPLVSPTTTDERLAVMGACQLLVCLLVCVCSSCQCCVLMSFVFCCVFLSRGVSSLLVFSCVVYSPQDKWPKDMCIV